MTNEELEKEIKKVKRILLAYHFILSDMLNKTGHRLSKKLDAQIAEIIEGKTK